MATFFKRKRRRTHTGPNKNEKKVLRGQEADRLVRTAGLMKDRFPSVQRLTVQLDFVTPQQHLLDRQTRVFNPTDVCDFSVSCPGRCGGQGAFDLEAKIKSVIDSRQARAEGSGTCAETLYPGSPEVCGSQLRCKIEATYSS